MDQNIKERIMKLVADAIQFSESLGNSKASIQNCHPMCRKTYQMLIEQDTEIVAHRVEDIKEFLDLLG